MQESQTYYHSVFLSSQGPFCYSGIIKWNLYVLCTLSLLSLELIQFSLLWRRSIIDSSNADFLMNSLCIYNLPVNSLSTKFLNNHLLPSITNSCYTQIYFLYNVVRHYVFFYIMFRQNNPLIHYLFLCICRHSLT